MEGETCNVSWKSHAHMLWKLCKLREEKRFTDATISCCGFHYPVHKLILAASSHYFEELFQQTEKVHPLVHPVVVLNNVQKSELDAILNFVYQGEVSVPKKDVVQLLEVARLLKIKGLCNNNLRDMCLSKKGIKSISLTPKGLDGTLDKSMLHAHSDDSVEVNEPQQQEAEKKRKNEDSGLSISDSISLAASVSPLNTKSSRCLRAKRRRKIVGEDDVSSESAVGINKEREAADSYTSQCTTRASSRCTSEARAKLGSCSDDHSATTATVLQSCSQSKDGSEAADVDRLAVHTPSEDVFISVGIGDNAEPVPGPSGYSSNNDDVEADENEEEGINFDEDEELLKIKEEIEVEPDSHFTQAMFIPEEDACVNDVLKKESDDPGGQESLNFEFVSTSMSPKEEESFAMEEDRPNCLKSHTFYKLSPSLSVELKDKFWEQEGVQQVLLSIREHKITLKDAALLLGTTYRILYRHYSSLFGGIKGAKDAESSETSNQEHPRNIDPKKFRKVEFHACPHCPYKNPYKHNFLEHLKFHIDTISSSNSCDSSKGEEPRSEEVGEEPRSEEASSKKDNLVSCDICSAKFAHLRTLRSHMQIHFNMTPLECPFCSVKFVHKTGFTAHLETHKNEKIFYCPLCKAKYENRYSLNKHLKVHYD